MSFDTSAHVPPPQNENQAAEPQSHNTSSASTSSSVPESNSIQQQPANLIRSSKNNTQQQNIIKTKRNTNKLGLSIKAPLSNDVITDSDSSSSENLIDEIPSFLLDQYANNNNGGEGKPNLPTTTSDPSTIFAPPTISSLSSAGGSPLKIKLLSTPPVLVSKTQTKSPSSASTISSASSPSEKLPLSAGALPSGITPLQFTPLNRPKTESNKKQGKKNLHLTLNLPSKNKVPGVGLDHEFSVSQSGTWKAGAIEIGKYGLKGSNEESPTVPSTTTSITSTTSDETNRQNASSGSTPISADNTTDASSPSFFDSITGKRKSPKINYEDLHISKTALGAGASAKVIRAVLKSDRSKRFAMKIIDLYEEGVKPKQIISEVKALYESVCCENVVKFYEAFHREGTIRLLIEYMDCGSLEDVYTTVGTIPEPVLAEMTFQILKALDYLEGKGIIHRDIKPANILLNKKGIVKLTDFGMSQQSESKKFKTFQGTYYYMSPERLRGDSHSFDSDIWSVGVSIAECACGSLPFEKGSESSLWNLLQYVTDSNVVIIKSGDFSDEFIDFVQKCMAKQTIDRPSAKQLFNHPWIRKYIPDPNAFAPTKTRQWIKEVYLPKKKMKKEEEQKEKKDFDVLKDMLNKYE
ncbi:hypothetical protein C9374_005792 [Naegleria lovaniensis]|uniref:mitogen-activated protein kinase kinase n=1 Tax=Naegleria lovaniensis TaxID=51637 RepID=A0AA88GKR0_NAELO|nr:uncharacterized protein C9374_005792 [Naegleria lovaniensis]KAG2382000.1 hypothetical protein C9374_005792 [Naegleria lovaniensis]